MRLRPYLFLFLVPAIPLTQRHVDRTLGEARSQDGVLYLWSGEQLKRLSPGFEDLMADVYWLRTVQYFGTQRAFATEKRYDLVYPLVDITTTLDPRLEIAYRYGSVFLCEPWPAGKGDPEAGIRLLEKGARNVPRSWRIRQDLGYFRYIYLHDAAGGARTLLEASRLPGAPFYLEALAGTILAKGGDRETARAVWKRLYQEAELPFLRENARYNLQRLAALDAIDALHAAVARCRASWGRAPRSIQELLQSGLVDRRFLVDPTGVPFDYDPQDGRFWFARGSRLWRSST